MASDKNFGGLCAYYLCRDFYVQQKNVIAGDKNKLYLARIGMPSDSNAYGKTSTSVPARHC